jgi:predicted amidophosphoribosyltransferase
MADFGEHGDIIEKYFLLLTPDGEELSGIKGFVKWCSDRNYPVTQKAIEYANLIREYDQFKKGDVIDATSKVNVSFEEHNQFLDHLYYLYPHSIPVFGKTKIAQLLFHAKQTQDKALIKRVLDMITPSLLEFIENEKPDAVAFVPATVPRNIQFMKELQRRLTLTMPMIPVQKIKTPILIQQKSLRDIHDRIKNAENTMAISDQNTYYKKFLLIDDFTGSGSTLNALAKKIKNQGVADEVVGITITGSMKEFEVIKEI